MTFPSMKMYLLVRELAPGKTKYMEMNSNRYELHDSIFCSLIPTEFQILTHLENTWRSFTTLLICLMH